VADAPKKPAPKALKLAKPPGGDSPTGNANDWRRYCRQCSNLGRERKCRVRNATMLDDMPRHCDDFLWHGKKLKEGN
jgi:hypothetical protein